jgi:phosphomannomutase
VEDPVQLKRLQPAETLRRMNRSIFKAYDIRGLVPEELDGTAAQAIGRALARLLGGGPVVIGRDMRESGKELGQGLTEGLRAEHREVVDIGRVSTPLCYYATTVLGAAGAAMITASHNPGRYNGFKICRERAVPVGIDSGLQDLRDAAFRLLGDSLPPSGGGMRRTDVADGYQRSLLELFPARPRLRVVIDAGNGIAGEAIAGLLSALPLELTRLYFEPDGRFPNHEANPLEPANMVDLQREVRARSADLGVAFDGDGDRVFFVDEHGERVPADLMTALFARTILEHHLLGARGGDAVLYDLRSTRTVAETVEALGARAVRGRVGHAYMKQRMRETNACFGGELSGHYYFRFPAGYVADDGAAAFLLALQVLELAQRPLSELWRPLRRYSQSGELNYRVAAVGRALARMRALFSEGKADELDGLTVQLAEGWFNLRPSNTEPLLRLNIEASSERELQRYRDRIEPVLREEAPSAAGSRGGHG